MYTIYVDDKLLYAPLLFHEGCSVYAPRLTLELNKAGSLEFKMPHTNLLYDSIEKLKSVVTVFKDEEEIFRGRLLHDEKDFFKQKQAYCEGELAYLIDSIQRPYKFEGDVATLFKQYISNHNSKVEATKQFTVGNVTVSGTVNCESKDYPNTYDEINTQIISTTGGYMQPRLTNGVRYLDLITTDPESGAVNVASQTIEFGANLLDITEYITAEDVFTVLIPLGGTIYDEEGKVITDKLTINDENGGKDYVEDSSAIALFGRIERKEEWTDIEDAKTLLSEGKKFLENNIALAVSLTVKAIDLSLLSVNYQRIRIGDWVQVISLPHELNRNFQCTKIVYDLENPEQNEYTFGYNVSSLTEQQVAEKKKFQNSLGVLSGLRTDIHQILNGGGSPVVPPTPGGDTSILPSGYTELEYIESTGTQYIDTGFKPNQDTRVEVDIAVTTGGTSFLFGTRNNSSANTTSNSFSMPQISGTSLRSDYGSVEDNVSLSPVQRLKIDKNKNVTTINGTTVTATTQTFSCTYNLVLLAVNTAGTISAETSAKLYSCQIYDNGTLVRDYVPCINDSGEVGLYDLVTKEFYGNDGTGLFYGGMKHELPSGYTELDYIEATGTQYIDTGFMPTNETRVVMDYLNTGDYSGNSSGVSMLFGVRTGTASDAYALWMSNTALYPNFADKGYSDNGSLSVDMSKRFTVDMNGNILSVNEQELVCVDSAFESPYSLVLLALNSKGTITARTTSGKIYSCKIYDNGSIVRDYIPCINDSGVAGLYDLVTKEFYGNSGTGEFTGREKVDLPAGYTMVNYIKSTGTQYIDTLYKQTTESQRVVMDFEYTTAPTSVSIFGAQNNTSNERAPIVYALNTNRPYVYVGSTGATVYTNISANVRYVFDVSTNNGSVSFTVDGSTQTATYAGKLAKTLTLYLFANNVDGKASQHSSIKVYGCKIYDNGTLIRNYIPCINSSGEAGLYDLVNETFYGNAGTGTFTTG